MAGCTLSPVFLLLGGLVGGGEAAGEGVAEMTVDVSSLITSDTIFLSSSFLLVTGGLGLVTGGLGFCGTPLTVACRCITGEL